MKTIRIVVWIEKCLSEAKYDGIETGQASTGQILEWINDNTRHGTTPHALGNVLSKNPKFEKCGNIKVGAFVSGHYQQALWKLT